MAEGNVAQGRVGDITEGFQEGADLNVSSSVLSKGGEGKRAVERGVVKARLGSRRQVGSAAEWETRLM